MEQSCEAEFEAAYQAIDVAIDDIGEALQIFGERFLGALYAPEVQAMGIWRLPAAARPSWAGCLRARCRSQALVAEALSAAMARGKLPCRPHHRDPPALRAARSRAHRPLPVPAAGAVGPDEIRGVTARAVAVFMAAYGPAPGLTGGGRQAPRRLRKT
jgi:hypothetical protein